MSFTKITSEDTQNKGVVGLPDTPGLSTGELQAKFDELATDVIIPKFNNLVDELDEMGFEKNVSSPTITDIRLSIDNTLQVSTDGGDTYNETASSGHKIMNGAGATFPQRSRLQFSANTIVEDNEQDGVTFVSIPSGQKGDRGEAATIQIGSVQSGDYASVVNVGSLTDAVFDMTLPKGNPGDAATIQVGTVQSGENPSVSNRGTSANAIFDFVLPKGEKGDPGTGLTLLGEYPTLSALQAAHPVGIRGNAYYVGNETSGVVYIWDVDASAWVNIGAMKGPKGDTGAAGTVAIGTVTEGNVVSVENVGTSENAILNFTLKKGDKGDSGNAATVSIGTVTKGDNASVVNVGTPTNAIFNMVLPKGDRGPQGNPTIVNGKSGENITLYMSDFFMTNYVKPATTSAIEPTDSVIQAIGKLEKEHDVLDDKITATETNISTLTQQLDGKSIRALKKSEYDSMESHDANTVYLFLPE